MPTTFDWAGDNSGDWETGSLWAGGTIPTTGADVTIDLTLQPNVDQTYTVTIAAGESITVDTLTLNAPNDTTNDPQYLGAVLQMDGTLTFDNAADSIDGSLQTEVFSNSGTFINAGTVAPFIQGSGNVLFTGTNGLYILNELQSVGTVIVDTSSISELIGNTLTDGIFSANGADTVIDLGGTLEGLKPVITAIEGPQANPGGWTELTYYGAGSEINEWNGSAYVPVSTSLTTIMGGGTVDVEGGATYTTTNALTINNVGSSAGPGMLDVQGGTVITAGITLSNAILQGFGTVEAPLVNNGTVVAEGGVLDLTGGVTGTGTILFDTNIQQQFTVATGATLVVGSVATGQTIVMNADDTLDLTTPSAFAGTIEVAQGAQIALSGLTVTSAVLNGDTLVVSDGTLVVAHLALANAGEQTTFSASGSIVTVVGASTPLSISGAAAGQTVAATATLTPFGSVSIADAVGQTETVTVTPSAAGNGTLSNLDGGSYNSTTGVYTVTGSAATVTTALDGLVFTPSATIMAGETVATTFTISATDTAGSTGTNSATTVTAIAAPQIDNTTAGTSYVSIYDPAAGESETISEYSGANGTGTLLSETVNRTDGTSLLYSFNPTTTVSETASVFSGPNVTGSRTTEVVDNTNGSSLDYAYNPSATVTLTAETWSGTDPSSGAPAGNLTSDVVDNSDGTSLLYTYNPTSTVTQTTATYSSTDTSDGAPAGNVVSDVVDNSNGTSIFYQYNPSSTITQTASYYSATNTDGSPAGSITSVTFDYTAGDSAITTYGSNGSSSTQYYSGPDGTGSPISGPAPSATAAATASAASDGSVITVTASNQLVDPGAGNFAIQFASGVTNDGLMLHPGSSDQVGGFSPSAGDTLNLSDLLNAANVNVGGDMSQLSSYVSVEAVNGSAQILFDPTGHGGGSQVALLTNDAGLVAQLQTLKSFTV